MTAVFEDMFNDVECEYVILSSCFALRRGGGGACALVSLDLFVRAKSENLRHRQGKGLSNK